MSPCERISLPKVPPRELVPLPREAVLALANEVPDVYPAVIVTGAGTGLRQGELLGLARERVDFLRRTLTVDAQLILLPGGPPYVAPPKTPASYRTVPLADVVLEALAEHLKRYPSATAVGRAGPAE